MKKRTFIALALSSVWCSQTYAVVCTDPSGNALHIQEMLKDAAMWAQEKSIYMAEMAQDKALSIWSASQSEYNSSAIISSTTTAVSQTQNASAEERYATSPSACESFSRAKSVLESMTSSCENPVTQAVFQNNQSQIVDCGNGGSGLNCGRVDAERKKIASALSLAITEQDGNKVINMLDGSKLLGMGSMPMHPSDKESHDIAMSLLLGVETPKNIPRLADGSLPDSANSNGARTMSNWARDQIIRSIPNAALARVKSLYDPKEDGSASTMAQLEDRVNYYSSEEFIKLLTNTNDKSQLPSNWNTLTPEQKHEWNLNAEMDEKLVSSEQVLRMLGEMESVSLQLSLMQLESTHSINGLEALQLKELSQ